VDEPDARQHDRDDQDLEQEADSPRTAAIDTFISEVSTTSTNIAIASRIASRGLPDASSGVPAPVPRSWETRLPEVVGHVAGGVHRVGEQPIPR
jgi:hypothetical protein